MVISVETTMQLRPIMVPLLGSPETAAILAEVKQAISEVNDFLDAEEKRINARFKQAGQALRVGLQKLTADTSNWPMTSRQR